MTLTSGQIRFCPLTQISFFIRFLTWWQRRTFPITPCWVAGLAGTSCLYTLRSSPLSVDWLFLTLQRILSDQGPLEASGPRRSRSGAQDIVQVTRVPTRANFFGLNSVIPPKKYIPTKACWSRINHVYPCKTRHSGYFHLELPTRKGSFHSQIHVNNH